MKRWATELSTPDQPVAPYFLQFGFRDISDPRALRFFNRVPTSFSLSDEQVDKLIATGRDLLRNHPGYRQLVADLGGTHFKPPN